MKKPLMIFAGLAMVSACSIAAILTAQERYESALIERRATEPNTNTPAIGASSWGSSPTSPYRLNTMNQLVPLPTIAGQARFYDSAGNKFSMAVQQAQRAFAAATTDEQRAEAQSKLREVLSAQFDADMKRRETELGNIRKRVTEMTALLEKRTSAKEEIVELRLQVISQDANGLGWADSNDGLWMPNRPADFHFVPASIGGPSSSSPNEAGEGATSLAPGFADFSYPAPALAPAAK